MPDFVTITCYVCKVQFGMPRDFYDVARRGAEVIEFYCPYGHGAVFSKGETDLQKMQRERDRLVQDAAYKDDRIKELEASRDVAWKKVSAAKGQITRIKNRASKGVCPCCNRHFTDLERHMHTKHPGFVTEPTADEHIN